MKDGTDRINQISPCEMCKGCPIEWTLIDEHLIGKCSIRDDDVHQGSAYYEGSVLCPDFVLSEIGLFYFSKAMDTLAMIAIELAEKVIDNEP